MPDRRVAYLVNQYPAVSHTFIRREIAALEARGTAVLRTSVRGWDADLVDPADIAERDRTRYLQKDGLLPLLGDVAALAASRPGRVLRALRAALAMSRKAVRPWPFHLVYLAQACRLARWCEAGDVAHLHAHFGTNPAEIAHLVHLLTGLPYSFTIHGRGEADGGARLHFPRKVGAARFVAAISGYTRSQLLREIPPQMWDRVRVVHCGLDAAFFEGEVPPVPDAPVFLTVGRLSAEKGHLVLLPAFARLLAAHPGARLVIAGDGPMRRDIEARVAGLGIGDAVRMAGWVTAEEVRAELAGATALVQPSFIEGLPVVIMEAMARQRPVIATYIAGIPELVVPGETGWLVPAGDVDALAGALAEAAAAPPERLSRMGDAGRTRARDRHLAETEAEKIAALMSVQAGTVP